VRLPVLVEANSGREHPIRPGVNIVGREGDVMLPDSKVSRKHAQVVSEDGVITVEDLGSTNGTLVNGDRLDAGSKRELNKGDTVSFGGVEVKLSLPGSAGATQMLGGNKTAALSAPPIAETEVEEKADDVEPAAFLVLSDNEIPLKEGVNTFGRKDDNDISIPDPYVSGRHGKIEVEDREIFFTDIGSTNGTFLNGTKLDVNVRTKIEETDQIVIGSIEFSLRLA